MFYHIFCKPYPKSLYQLTFSFDERRIWGLSAWLLGPALACSLNAHSLTRSAIITKCGITLARSLELILNIFFKLARSLRSGMCVLSTLARSLWSRKVVVFSNARSLTRTFIVEDFLPKCLQLNKNLSCVLARSQNSWMNFSSSLAQWGQESYLHFYARSLTRVQDIWVFFSCSLALVQNFIVFFHARSLTRVQDTWVYFSRSLARSGPGHLCVFFTLARSLGSGTILFAS